MDLFPTDDGHIFEFSGPEPGLELELHIERHEGALIWFWLASQDGDLLAYGRAATA